MERIVILSGPSGAGKSSLCSALFKEMDNIYFSISSTTRKKRAGEIDNVHYKFISEGEFLSGIKNNVFLEWAKVHDNYYGTERAQITRALGENKIVLFDIDVQGQKSIKKHYPHAVSIFITTKNKEVLESRLTSRALDSDEIIKKRINMAINEIKEIELFDYIIINDDFSRAFEGFLSIIKSLDFKNDISRSAEIRAQW